MADAPYAVDWTPAARRALQRLPPRIAPAVIELIYGPLAENPQRVGKPLRFDLEGLHSARRGDFRVIYRIGDTRVSIVAVDHRAEVYRPRDRRP